MDMIGMKEGSFEWALMMLKAGAKMQRKNWNIDMKTADGSITIGWAPSQVDMLAEDWQTFK